MMQDVITYQSSGSAVTSIPDMSVDFPVKHGRPMLQAAGIAALSLATFALWHPMPSVSQVSRRENHPAVWEELYDGPAVTSQLAELVDLPLQSPLEIIFPNARDSNEYENQLVNDLIEEYFS